MKLSKTVKITAGPVEWYISMKLFKTVKITAGPIEWHTDVASDNLSGYVGGDKWCFRLFAITRHEFTETGETFCLDSKLSDCINGFASIDDAKRLAQEQWQQLVQRGTELS